jgi:two-component system, response regulator RegA
MSEAATVLLVDDDEYFVLRLAHSLELRGYAVRTATGVAAATALARQESPELAVVDFRMADGNGLDLLKALKSLDDMTQIVILTGFGSMAVAVEAMRLGATSVISKPVDADDILRAFSLSPQAETDNVTTAVPSLARAEWEHIARVLSECEHNISEAARRLGIHRRSLQRKLQKPPFDLK